MVAFNVCVRILIFSLALASIATLYKGLLLFRIEVESVVLNDNQIIEINPVLFHRVEEETSKLTQLFKRDTSRCKPKLFRQLAELYQDDKSPSSLTYFPALKASLIKFYAGDGANKCSNATEAIFVVSSASGHFEARSAIRDTWGQEVRNLGHELVFLIGLGRDEIEKRAIADEITLNSDIIGLDFEDTFQSLTFKSLAFLNWTSNYCPTASHVIKTEDDVMVNVTAIQALLRINDRNENVLYGHVHSHWFPERSNSRFQSYVPKNVYPWRYYPEFCNRALFVLTNVSVQQMLKTVPKIPFFFLDDVYLTGMLATASKTKLMHVPSIPVVSTAIGCCGVMASPGNLPEEMKTVRDIWKYAGCKQLFTDNKMGHKPEELEPVIYSTVRQQRSCRWINRIN